MKKYHRIVKIERIRKELQQGNFVEAYELASTIDVDKIKIMGDLGLIAEACFYAKQYRNAKEYYIKVYKETNSRRILSQLVHVSIKLRELETANCYLKEFEELAPDDFYRYIYRYQLDRLEGKPLEECIKALETLKREEYIDHWAYELAKLYHKMGEEEKCQEECDRIILWFGEGDYVNRAKALKAYYRGELDVTLVGSDAEGFSREIQRVLQQEEEDVYPGEGFGDEDELLEGENELTEEEFYKEDTPLEQETYEKEILSYEKHSEEEDLLFNISRELANAITDVEEENRDVLSAESGNVSTENEKHHKQVNGHVLSEEVFEQTVYKFLQRKEKGNVLSEDDSLQSSSCEEEEQKEEYQEDILMYPVLSDDVLKLDADSNLFALMREKEVSLSAILGNFLQIEQVRMQTVKTLELISREKGNKAYFIVTGETGPGSAQLLYAKSMAKVLYRLGIIRSNRIALIEGDKLNRMDLASKAYQLKDSCLIIEHAGDLEKEAMVSLLSLCERQGGNIAVILEDSRTHMNRLLRGNAEFFKMFDMRIHLPKYTNENWKGFVYDYLKGADYDLTLKADMLLTKKIDELLKNRKENIWDAVFSMMQDTVDRAEKRNEKMLHDLSTVGKLDSTKLMVVQEEDF